MGLQAHVSGKSIHPLRTVNIYKNLYNTLVSEI